jgi:gas vesicle structural protein
LPDRDVLGPPDGAASPPALVDVLDRVLERGLLLQADVVLCVAGVPLVGLNLRAALAGMETMTRYGLLVDWDRRIRAQAVEAPAHVHPGRD